MPIQSNFVTPPACYRSVNCLLVIEDGWRLTNAVKSTLPRIVQDIEFNI